VHVFDLVAYVLDQSSPPLNLVYLQSIAVRIVLDGFDAVDQVAQVGAEVCECGFEFIACFDEFGGGCRRGRGADADVAVEEWSRCVEEREDVTACALVLVPKSYMQSSRDRDVRLDLEKGVFGCHGVQCVVFLTCGPPMPQ
jgi:hypothetical protein